MNTKLTGIGCAIAIAAIPALAACGAADGDATVHDATADTTYWPDGYASDTGSDWAGYGDPTPDPWYDAATSDTPSDATSDTSVGSDTAYDPGYDTGYDAAYDAALDTASDPGHDTAPPDAATDPGTPDAAPDAPPADAVEEDPPEEDVCSAAITEPQVLYMSADDSNSMASPIIARALIESGSIVPAWSVRTWEFTNYFDVAYEPAAPRRLNVAVQMLEKPSHDGYVMQIGAQSHALADEDRRPLNITFVLDNSGSMSGTPIALERQVCTDIAHSLRSGDVVSMVVWNTTRRVLLDSHAISGPDDPHLVDAIADLDSTGSTDLHGGLVAGYDLATANYSEGRLNRVILVSDGQANVGVTDEDLIAEHADDEEREGIYLVGVGVGSGYNDTLMDAVTDEGKGAYVFIDSASESAKIFGDRFLSTLEIAVMDVQVELTIPPWLRIEVFHGEEISTIPKEVEPQHLAPNDAMIFHQELVACSDPVPGDTVRVVARYTDPVTWARHADQVIVTIGDLLASQSAPELIKGTAVVSYAEGLKEVSRLLDIGAQAAAQSECDEVAAGLGDAADASADAELDEIAGLMDEYCTNLLYRHTTPWY